MVTAGPGVTNCVTAMANAQLERVPVLLIGGCAPVRAGRPRPAAGHRPRRHHAAGHAQRRARCASPTTCCATSTRRCATARGRRQSARVRCTSRFRPTCCARRCRRRVVLPEYLAAKRAARAFRPTPPRSSARRALIAQARRPLVLTGRGALGAGAELVALPRSPRGALYLDTQESRGLVPRRASVGRRRGARARDAGGRPRRSSSAASSTTRRATARRRCCRNARFLRIGDNCEELRENRRGEVELFADPGARARGAGATRSRKRVAALDTAWTAALRAEHVRRADEVRGRARRARPPARTATCIRTASSPRCAKVLRPDAITDRRRRRHPELRAHGPGRRAPTSTPARSAASASARPTAWPPRCCIRTGRWWSSPATARSASTRWRSTRPSGTARRSCSSSPTTRRGTSSGSTRR